MLLNNKLEDNILMSQFAEMHLTNKRIPISGGIELMSGCNLKCVHCYEESSRWKKNISTDDLKNFIDQAVEMGLLSIFLTGGEAMLREDFDDIYKYIREKGVLVTILSNGTTITEDKIKLFTEYPPLLLDISIYGASEKTYQKVCRVDGAFDKLISNLEMLKRYNIPFTLKTVLMRENVNDLEEMREIAKRFQVGFKYFTNIRAMNDGDNSPMTHMLTLEEIMEIEKKDLFLADFYKHIEEYEVKNLSLRKEKNYCYLCNIAHNGFFITNDGYMYGCVRERLHGYNLKEGTFRDCWENHFVHCYLDKISNTYSKCYKCEYIKYCEYCPAQFELDTGSTIIPSDTFCELAKFRKKNFAD